MTPTKELVQWADPERKLKVGYCVLYVRLRKSTKDFLTKQAQEAEALGVGEYLDYLVDILKKGNKEIRNDY